MRNSRKMEDIGLATAIKWFIKSDYAVSTPITSSQQYNIVAEKDNKFYRVQVKTTTFKNRYGTYVASIKTCDRNGAIVKRFDGTKVDFLFIVNAEYEMYLIPTDSSTPGTTISLGKSRSRFKVSK